MERAFSEALVIGQDQGKEAFGTYKIDAWQKIVDRAGYNPSSWKDGMMNFDVKTWYKSHIYTAYDKMWHGRTVLGADAGSGAGSGAKRSSGEERAHGSCSEESSGISVPCVDPRCGVLLRLPEGFDKRSHQLLGTLRAQRAC